jgi:hypothetical protein
MGAVLTAFLLLGRYLGLRQMPRADLETRSEH